MFSSACLCKKPSFTNLKIGKTETYQPVLLQRGKLFICHVFDFYTELGWRFIYDYVPIKVILQASVDMHAIDYDPLTQR